MKANHRANERAESRVTRGSGNVFNDLGFSAREASELQVKAELTRQIMNRIKQLGLTQIQASQRLRIGQPDVSKLKAGRFVGFTTDRLIALLNALEVDVDIVIRPRKQGRHHRLGVVKVHEMVVAAG